MCEFKRQRSSIARQELSTWSNLLAAAAAMQVREEQCLRWFQCGAGRRLSASLRGADAAKIHGHIRHVVADGKAQCSCKVSTAHDVSGSVIVQGAAAPVPCSEIGAMLDK